MNKLLPRRERKMKWMLCCSRQHFSQGAHAAALLRGGGAVTSQWTFSRQSHQFWLHISLGLEGNFSKIKVGGRKAPTYLPIIRNLREVSQEGTTECFQFASEQKERAKENWNALVKPETPHFSGQDQNGVDILKGCLLFQEFVWKIGVVTLQ